MEEVFIRYKEHLKSKNLSINSTQAYISDVSQFITYLKESDKDLHRVDKFIIMNYVQKLKSLNNSDTSIARKIIALRGFFSYLIWKENFTFNPLKEFKLPRCRKPLPQILSIEEVDRFLNVPETGDFKEIRDKAMLELMYATGMKVNELINLTVDDINLKLCYTKCFGAKNKERIIPFGSVAAKALEKYLKIRDKYNKNCINLLFLNNYSEKLSRQGFWKIVKYYAKAANIEKEINPTTLRHSFAVHLLENGADLKSIQDFLGHSNMAAIQVYAAVTKKSKLLDVYKNTHPRA